MKALSASRTRSRISNTVMMPWTATGWTLAVLIFLVTMVQLHLMRAFREEEG